MSNKAFVLFFVIMAVLLAVLGSVLPPSKIGYFMHIGNFFNTMIPVLAVGALLKYLCGNNAE